MRLSPPVQQLICILHSSFIIEFSDCKGWPHNDTLATLFQQSSSSDKLTSRDLSAHACLSPPSSPFQVGTRSSGKLPGGGAQQRNPSPSPLRPLFFPLLSLLFIHWPVKRRGRWFHPATPVLQNSNNRNPPPFCIHSLFWRQISNGHFFAQFIVIFNFTITMNSISHFARHS